MLIVGLGNPHRGDDAAGILVVRRLRERGLNIVEQHGGPLDLFEIWETANSMVLVDAVLSGSEPGAGSVVGAVHIWDARSARLRNEAFRSSTHSFGLADAIELARTLDRLPKHLVIYGIEAAQFVAGMPPSAQVLKGVESAVEHIATLWLQASTTSQAR